jgi:GNAT superfamily N-acetyltransferase
MAIHFQKITSDNLYIALEMINSNPDNNVLENGVKTRTLAEIEEELLNPMIKSVLIMLDDTYIGIMDYLMENPKDHCPWLGLLMIHGDYQGFGFGSQAYLLYENMMLERGIPKIRIGVIKENLKAHDFWTSLGFTYYKTAVGQNNKEILVYEKNFPREVSNFN